MKVRNKTIFETPTWTLLDVRIKGSCPGPSLKCLKIIYSAGECRFSNGPIAITCVWDSPHQTKAPLCLYAGSTTWPDDGNEGCSQL